MADLSTIDAILKEDYLGPIREQLNQRTPSLRRLRRSQASTVGKEMYIPLHVGRNSGVGARSEKADLPEPGSQKYEKLLIRPAYLYGRIELTGQAIAQSARERGAFVQALREEMRGLARDLRRDLNRQAYNDSLGTLAVCGTTASSTTVQLEPASNMNLLEEGMVIDIVAASTGTPVTNGTRREIVAVDKQANTITLDPEGGAVTTSSSHIVVRHGSYAREWIGLKAWAATTGNTIGNIDRSQASYFNPNVLHNNGTPRALSLDLMQQAFDEVDIRTGGNVTVGFMDHALRRKYLNLLRTERRYVSVGGDGSEMTLDGGFRAVQYNGVPIIVDSAAPKGTIIFGDESTATIYYVGNSDFDWMDRDGAILHRVSNKDAYEATLFWYSQLVIDTPGSWSAITDLSEN